MNIKTKNGELIEEIITNYVNENIFEPITKIKKSLQYNLDSILKFKTKVNDIKNKNGFIFGNINFINEDGTNSVMNFTITYNDKTI
jgi:vesicle coat complex subunit